MDETLAGILGLVLLLGFPIGLAILLFLRAEKKRVRQPSAGHRRTFFIFLAIIIAAGGIVAIGIQLKSDLVFIVGFGILGFVMVARGVWFLLDLAQQK